MGRVREAKEAVAKRRSSITSLQSQIDSLRSSKMQSDNRDQELDADYKECILGARKAVRSGDKRRARLLINRGKQARKRQKLVRSHSQNYEKLISTFEKELARLQK